MATNAVAIKLPEFWESSAAAWFSTVEAQFEIRKITDDKTRYYYVVAALGSSVASRLVGLLTDPQRKINMRLSRLCCLRLLSYLQLRARRLFAILPLCRFLCDTGAQRSVIPASEMDIMSGEHGPQLATADGSPIHSYGVRQALDPAKLAVAKAEFAHMEQVGIIRRSDSPWASPSTSLPSLVAGGVHAGTTRLNDATTPDRYPVPHIQDFSAHLSDDILIASATEEEHLSHLRALFTRLSQHGLIVNPAKCLFGRAPSNSLDTASRVRGLSPSPSQGGRLLPSHASHSPVAEGVHWDGDLLSSLHCPGRPHPAAAVRGPQGQEP
ncbi:hypothetical protein AAFF_G00425870 [Aldrovandia affinis]|uniref:ribonuclease H n=1 Tax=Aldrovandia affinis TaxID=143900 RepID=A0AAD7T784_9TELE|nr:hypothetical protein AAFF_G00425870 [Aldrovandia affinis]